MDPVRLGYVGCGFMAQKVHIPNFISLPNCELLAIAEVRNQLGQKVQQKHQIPKLYQGHIELAKDDEIEDPEYPGSSNKKLRNVDVLHWLRINTHQSYTIISK